MARQPASGPHPLRALAPDRGRGFGVRGAGLLLAGTRQPGRGRRRRTRLSPPHGHGAPRHLRCRDRKPHRGPAAGHAGSAGPLHVKPVHAVIPRAWQRPSARVGLVTLGVLVVLALLGPLALPEPAHQGNLLTHALLPPQASHPFGTDQLSRDVLSRVVSGLRLSLSIGLIAAALAVGLGTGVGLAAGTLRGAVESVLMRTVDALLAIPRLFVLLLAAAMWDRVPLAALVLLLGVTGWYGTSRLVRAEVARLRNEPFAAA